MMYEGILTGATAGVLTASVWFGIQWGYQRYRARRELRRFGMMVEGWWPGLILDDKRITDDMQYKAVCESLVLLVSESHIEYSAKMYLLYVLKEGIWLADNERVYGEYFSHLLDTDGNFRLPEDSKYGRSGVGW